MKELAIKKGRTAVCGVFKEKAAFESAMDKLREQGFRQSDISVLLPGNQNMNTFAYQKTSRASEGSVLGGIIGLAVGAWLGWMLGAGSFTIPGLTAFLAAGTVVSALAVAGIGCTLGGLVGATLGWRIPKYEAQRYDSFINEGDTLVSIHTDDATWTAKAKILLDSCGAVDIGTTKEKKYDSREVIPPHSRGYDSVANGMRI